MADETTEAEAVEITLSENQRLEVLKARARVMGIEFSNNIRADTLAKRIQDKLNEVEPGSEAFDESDEAEALAAEDDGAKVPDLDLNPLAGDKAGQTPAKKLSPRQRLLNENMRLIRCRITNLDPKKKDLPGEVITVANDVIGTVRKFVPFGEQTDDGYHLEYCLFKVLARRRFLQIRTRRDPRTGTNRIEQNWVREFSLEVLDQLTEKELADLANAQAAAGVFAPGSE